MGRHGRRSLVLRRHWRSSVILVRRHRRRRLVLGRRHWRGHLSRAEVSWMEVLGQLGAWHRGRGGWPATVVAYADTHHVKVGGSVLRVRVRVRVRPAAPGIVSRGQVSECHLVGGSGDPRGPAVLGRMVGSDLWFRRAHTRSEDDKTNITKQKPAVGKEVSIVGRPSRAPGRTGPRGRWTGGEYGTISVNRAAATRGSTWYCGRSGRAKRLGRHPLPRSHPSACLVE